jgi:hypothetical protein
VTAPYLNNPDEYDFEGELQKALARAARAKPQGKRWERTRLPESAHAISYRPTGEMLTPTLPVLPNKLARHVKLYGRAGTEQWYGSRERSKVEENVMSSVSRALCRRRLPIGSASVTGG